MNERVHQTTVPGIEILNPVQAQAFQVGQVPFQIQPVEVLIGGMLGEIPDDHVLRDIESHLSQTGKG